MPNKPIPTQADYEKLFNNALDGRYPGASAPEKSDPPKLTPLEPHQAPFEVVNQPRTNPAYPGDPK